MWRSAVRWGEIYFLPLLRFSSCLWLRSHIWTPAGHARNRFSIPAIYCNALQMLPVVCVCVLKRSDFERGAKHEPQTARRRPSESKLPKMHVCCSTSGIGECFLSGGRWRWGWFQETHAAAWKSHTHSKKKPCCESFRAREGDITSRRTKKKNSPWFLL